MNQEAFQKRFEEQPTKMEQKVHVKMYDKYRLKILLVFFVVFIGIFGLILVVRGYFISNPPNSGDQGVYASLYKTFFPNSGVNRLDIPSVGSNGTDTSAIQQISTPFSPTLSKEKKWLILRNNNETFIGYLDDKDKFTYAYRIPLSSEDIRLFENESILYFTNAQKVNEVSTFVLKEKNLKNAFSKTLEDGSSFYNVYYEPSNQSFYYTYTNESKALYLDATNLANKTVSIFQTNFLVGDTSIEYIDLGQNIIYLQNTSHCYMLSLISKNLSEIGCEYVKRNNDGILFWSNGDGENATTQYAGEIYESYQNDKLREIISEHLSNSSDTILKPSDDLRRVVYSTSLGEVFGNLSYSENTLYFTLNKLVQKSSVSWVSNPQSIGKIAISPNNISIDVITTALPKTKIYKLIPIGSELYAIVEGDYLGYQKLMKYYPDGTVVYYPLSYPSTPTSYPLSYPTSYSVTEYWREVPLNLVELETIEVLTPKYIL